MGEASADSLRGGLLVVTAASLWGTTGVAAKISYGFGMSPEGILTLRLALTIPIYAALILAKSPSKPSLAVVVIGLLVLGPYHILYYYSILYIGVSTASLLLYTHPVVVSVLSRFVIKEALSKRTYAALAISVAGATLISLGEISFSAVGIALAASSSILFSLYVVLSKLAMEAGVRPDEVALGSSPWALPAVLVFQASKGFGWAAIVGVEVMAVAVYLALVVSTLAYLLYMRGLKVVGAARATILSTAEPLTATAISTILFGEPVTVLKTLGGGMIVAAVALVAK